MDFLLYEVKTAVAIAVFYIFYRLLLSRETFHRFNRVVLLFMALLAFVLPFCVITVHEVVSLPAPVVQSQSVQTQVFVEATEVVPSVPWWQIALTVLFLTGFAVTLCYTLFSVLKVWRLIANGEKHHLETDEILVVTDRNVAPFSWMKYIVVSRADYEDRENPEVGFCEIIAHERAHIALVHSWDLLFVSVLVVMQWFNPAVWMLKADLKAIHEFEADDAVLRSGINARQYQYLLVKKAVGMSGYSIANSFNHSTLKQRITMMLSKKSSSMRALKALYIVPLVGISLAATARTVTDVRYDDVRQKPETATVQAQQDTMCVFVDGKQVPYSTYSRIDPATIYSVTVLKDTSVVTPAGIKVETSKPTVTIVTKEAYARLEKEHAQAEKNFVAKIAQNEADLRQAERDFEKELAQAEKNFAKAKKDLEKAYENFVKAKGDISDVQADAVREKDSRFVTVKSDRNVNAFVASSGDPRLIRVYSDSTGGFSSHVEYKVEYKTETITDAGDVSLSEDLLVLQSDNSAGQKDDKTHSLTVVTKEGVLNPSDYLYVVNGKVLKHTKNSSSVTVVPPVSSFTEVTVRRDPETLKKYKAKDKKGVLFITTK